MAIIEQCSRCGRELSSCPYYDKDATEPCKSYQFPIDNSGFFSNFFSINGRIGRVQYLVMMLITVIVFYALTFYISFWVAATTGTGDIDKKILIITVIAAIPASALMIVAGIRRCHDSGASWWYSIMPIVLLFSINILTIVLGAGAIFFLFFQKGDEFVNNYGTEPLKTYKSQVRWNVEEKEE